MSAPETLKEPEALREEVRPLPPAEAAPAADGTLPPLPEASAVSELLPEGMGLDVLRSGRIVSYKFINRFKKMFCCKTVKYA